MAKYFLMKLDYQKIFITALVVIGMFGLECVCVVFSAMHQEQYQQMFGEFMGIAYDKNLFLIAAPKSVFLKVVRTMDVIWDDMEDIG